MSDESRSCERCGEELDPDKGEPKELATGPDEWDEVCTECVEDLHAKDMSIEEILTRRRL